MADYNYTAANIKGKTVKGTLSVTNAAQLKSALAEQKLFLLEYSEVEVAKGRRLKSNELAEFCRELGSMLGAGVSLVRTMTIIIERDLSKNLKNVFSEINKQIKRGISLSEAMQMQGKAFPELLLNMIRAGEASGRLDETCNKMADYYDKEHKLNGEIKSALTYPIMLAILTLLIIIGIFTFIFPRFVSLFDGMELPAITQFMIAISDMFTKRWYILIIIAVVLVFFILFLRASEPVRYKIDKIKIHLPKIGKLLRTIYTARFARTFSSLYSSGVSIMNALQISSTTIGNRYIAQQFGAVVNDVRSGVSISNALTKIDGFDKKLAQTIIIGEETGRLDDLLERIADSFDYEASMAIKKLVKLIEPIMICIMALVIVTVILSVMMPIYEMYGQVAEM